MLRASGETLIVIHKLKCRVGRAERNPPSSENGGFRYRSTHPTSYELRARKKLPCLPSTIDPLFERWIWIKLDGFDFCNF